MLVAKRRLSIQAKKRARRWMDTLSETYEKTDTRNEGIAPHIPKTPWEITHHGSSLNDIRTLLGSPEKKGEGMGISKLGLRLRDARFRPAGEAVVRGYDAFQGYLTALFNRKTEAQDIGYVTQNIKVDESNRLDGARINSVYKVFDDRYKKEIKKCLDEGLGDSYLVSRGLIFLVCSHYFGVGM